MLTSKLREKAVNTQSRFTAQKGWWLKNHQPSAFKLGCKLKAELI
nr:hypothetical protein [Providencia stuartii]